MSIIFATTNKSKLAEARSILGVEIVGKSLEIDEIQSLDPEIVAIKKARAYFKQIKKPIFVEDTSLRFHALGRLPGTYVDSFMQELGNEGLIKLLGGKANRRATAEVHIIYIDKDGEHAFRGHTRGTIVKKVAGDKGFGWDPIFAPGKQSKTFAEMNLEEKNKYSMRRRALKEFKKWLTKNKEL